jgi:hypothetical protein
MQPASVPCSVPRWIVALIALVGALLALAAPAAAAEQGELKLRSNGTAAVTAGDTAWVLLDWTAKGGAVDDLHVTVAPRDGIGIGYPSNTGDHSGPYNGYRIEEGEIDYTAIQISVPYDASKKYELKVTATYNDGKNRESFDLKLNVATYRGDDVVQVSDESQVPVEGGWVEVAYSGMAPSLSDFRVQVTDAAGLPIEYPQTTYTSLAGDALLEDGETDVVRFYVGPSSAGSYEVTVRATYLKGSAQGSIDGTVLLDVG